MAQDEAIQHNHVYVAYVCGWSLDLLASKAAVSVLSTYIYIYTAMVFTGGS